MASSCVKVHKQSAQDAKMALLKHELLDIDREPSHEGDAIFFPIVETTRERLQSVLVQEFELVDGKCPARKHVHKGSLGNMLGQDIPPSLSDKIPRAFNLIGNIAVLDLDDAMTPFKTAITRAMTELHPHVKAIYAKRSERAGDFRTSELELIHGSDDPITTHLENGCRFLVDVKGAFFDPRLVHEHERVVERIKNSCAGAGTCNVLDLFCGVGPFVIPLAKDTRIRSWAVDLNPRAIELLAANIKANKVDPTRISGHAMDARDFLAWDGDTSPPRESLLQSPRLPSQPPPPPPRAFDAIILNLPRLAHEFLATCNPRAKKGTAIYWYTIAREFFDGKSIPGEKPGAIKARLDAVSHEDDANPVNEICARGLETVASAGYEIIEITRVKPFSPYKFTYCFELRR
jgi:tRNA G37 N-methylase Trm5